MDEPYVKGDIVETPMGKGIFLAVLKVNGLILVKLPRPGGYVALPFLPVQVMKVEINETSMPY